MGRCANAARHGAGTVLAAALQGRMREVHQRGGLARLREPHASELAHGRLAPSHRLTAVEDCVGVPEGGQ